MEIAASKWVTYLSCLVHWQTLEQKRTARFYPMYLGKCKVLRIFFFCAFRNLLSQLCWINSTAAFQNQVAWLHLILRCSYRRRNLKYRQQVPGWPTTLYHEVIDSIKIFQILTCKVKTRFSVSPASSSPALKSYKFPNVFCRRLYILFLTEQELVC